MLSDVTPWLVAGVACCCVRRWVDTGEMYPVCPRVQTRDLTITITTTPLHHCYVLQTSAPPLSGDIHFIFWAAPSDQWLLWILNIKMIFSAFSHAALLLPPPPTTITPCTSSGLSIQNQRRKLFKSSAENLGENIFLLENIP